ncbi:MAG: DegV family protein [Clostridia bacterium]|nr:DegV family protein [Clostridia bacterium]
MNNFYITTDMTADFPPSLFEENFAIVNMSYYMDNILYDGADTPYLSAQQFYNKLRAGSVSQTSLVTIEQALEFFRPILAQGFDILHISFAQSLSGSYKSYICAVEKLKSEFPDRKIIVVDSNCASLGEGLLTYYTLKQRELGKSIEECAEYAEHLKQHIIHIFSVDDMFHLYRGGRVSRGTAIIGNAIQLKPILVMDENGLLKPTDKKIGKKPALRTMLEKMIQKMEGYENEVIFIGHGDAEAEAEWLARKITEKTGIKNIVINNVGAVIGSHCGAGLVTVFCVGINRLIK